MSAQPGQPTTPADLEETRAALAPTLEQTAAILPWVRAPQPLRFPAELNERWETACTRLRTAWDERLTEGDDSVRSSIYGLLSIALETHDADALQLAEALAGVADRLDAGPLPTRAVAAVTATLECLREPGGLENSGFAQRAQHFSQRLGQSLAPSLKPGERSDVVDRLFLVDARERLERMHEALDVLPVDVYALTLESHELTQQAEQIDMWGIVHLGRQLENFVRLMDEASEDMQDRARSDIIALLA